MKNQEQFRNLICALQNQADDGLINQLESVWAEGNSCCVGAYTMAWLDCFESECVSYEDAPVELAAFLDCSVYQVIQLLRDAGAPFDPFGTEEWDYDEVFSNLAKVEELPPDNVELKDTLRNTIAQYYALDEDEDVLDSMRYYAINILGATAALSIFDFIMRGENVPVYWEGWN